MEGLPTIERPNRFSGTLDQAPTVGFIFIAGKELLLFHECTIHQLFKPNFCLSSYLGVDLKKPFRHSLIRTITFAPLYNFRVRTPPRIMAKMGSGLIIVNRYLRQEFYFKLNNFCRYTALRYHPRDGSNPKPFSSKARASINP